jgi:integrase
MRKPSLSIKKVKISVKVFYQVAVTNGEGGRLKRKTFSDKKDALTFLAAAKIQNENYGAAAFTITDTLRTDAIRAAEILAGINVSLTEAARFYRNDHERRTQGKAFDKAIEHFLASNASKNAVYRANLKSRLGHFAAAAVGKNTMSVDADDISRFLAELTYAPRTVDHYWSQLNSFFIHCKNRKWVTDNPMTTVARKSVVSGDIEFLTPKDAARILQCCDDHILAGVVIGLFCGLRQSEIERLDWSAVDLSEGQIKLSAAKVKNSARRVVPIPACAIAWLTPHQETSGPIWPAKEIKRDLWEQARVKAGYGPYKQASATTVLLQTDPKTGLPKKGLRPWPDNALRHTAISYKVATSPDLEVIAYESGNSAGIIKEHYNGLATSKQAAAFYDIMPPSQNQIVRMTA